MGAITGIAWCDSTWNPWWGCTKVSAGCSRCYAETLARRWDFDVWGTGGRRFFGDKHWNEPRKWDRAASKAGIRKRVFCASMADVFEDRRDLDGQRFRLWELIDSTRSLDWLLLTKRPEKIAEMIPRAWLASPLPNVWLGTSVEDQPTADARIPLLLKAPAWIRFASYEPALGPVRFDCWTETGCPRGWLDEDPGIDWLIIGGESGPGARPFEVQWARDAIRQCREAGVAAFCKQLGSLPLAPVGEGETAKECADSERTERLMWPEGTRWSNPTKQPEFNGRVLLLRDRKGGDPTEWPIDLRVQQFPERAR